jgi:hypothetical protein
MCKKDLMDDLFLPWRWIRMKPAARDVGYCLFVCCSCTFKPNFGRLLTKKDKAGSIKLRGDDPILQVPRRYQYDITAIDEMAQVSASTSRHDEAAPSALIASGPCHRLKT